MGGGQVPRACLLAGTTSLTPAATSASRCQLPFPLSEPARVLTKEPAAALGAPPQVHRPHFSEPLGFDSPVCSLHPTKPRHGGSSLQLPHVVTTIPPVFTFQPPQYLFNESSTLNLCWNTKCGLCLPDWTLIDLPVLLTLEEVEYVDYFMELFRF